MAGFIYVGFKVLRLIQNSHGNKLKNIFFDHT